MYQTVSFSMFVDAFRDMGRENQFSAIHARGASLGAHEALRVLFDYLEDCDDNIELDVIALCCEFSHDTATEIANQYNIDIFGDADEDEIRNSNREDEVTDIVREYLENQGVLVGETDYGFVYRQH
jgi:hypothetical protein